MTKEDWPVYDVKDALVAGNDGVEITIFEPSGLFEGKDEPSPFLRKAINLANTEGINLFEAIRIVALEYDKLKEKL